MKKTPGSIFALLLVLGCVWQAQAAVSVTNIEAKPRYPWNGLVDIDYTVVCDDPTADIWVYPVGYDHDFNVSMAPRSLSGDGANAPVKAGTHRMTWNVTDDYPDFVSSAFTVKMSALTGGAPYMVIDVSGGVDALSYPVSYLSSVPEGGWTDEYKGDKIVLRLIPPGTFMMGSPVGELGRIAASENQRQVTLTQPFYIGVFEITQKQYMYLMGTNPAFYGGSYRPVGRISYSTVRGSVNGAGWPTHNQVDANSFIGRVRSKANVLADLPTEAQWEYACRAGTSTALNSGKNLIATGTCANMAEVGRHYQNVGDGKGGWTVGTTTVGSYLPNAWGLYDMHGNVSEWCLDFYVASPTGSVDPKGASSGNRVYKSAHHDGLYNSSNGEAWHCRSGFRSSLGSSSSDYASGFRLLVSPVVE